MEALERENTARVARGGKPRRLHPEWVNRPKLAPHEAQLRDEFMRLARSCGGQPTPTDMLAWFEMRGVDPAEREWMADVFGAMASVLREAASND